MKKISVRFRLTLVALVFLLNAGCAKSSLERDLVNASGTGNIQETKRLLSLGANVNGKDNTLDAWTPLIAAVDSEHKEIVELLLNAGANPNIHDGHGRTALFYVLRRENGSEIIKSLILAGAQTEEFLEEIQALGDSNLNRIAFEDALKHKREGMKK